MARYDLQDIMSLEKYVRISLINKITGLKSANLIGTKNSIGNSNLAIFNSVMHIGANPPLLGFIMRPLLAERHTYANIKETGYFTINMVSTEIHKQAHKTSANFPSAISEFHACGLTETYIDDYPAPFVKESKVQIGLSFQEESLIKANNTILIVGKIEKIILLDTAAKKDGDIDLESLEAVGIGGLDTYYTCKRIARYQYARVEEETKKID